MSQIGAVKKRLIATKAGVQQVMSSKVMGAEGSKEPKEPKGSEAKQGSDAGEAMADKQDIGAGDGENVKELEKEKDEPGKVDPAESEQTRAETPKGLSRIAQGLREGKYRNVAFMVGAGISTSAGIPDFRSPGTGLYANLQRLQLPYPEAVFVLDYFRNRPEAFYTLAQELYPGKFQPTKFHEFMNLVQERGHLRRVFTQNIDTLEQLAGIESDKIVAAHGSFASNHCIECNHEMTNAEMQKILSGPSSGKHSVPIPYCVKCGGLIKPDIVFFGESLPSRFFTYSQLDLPDNVDLVIVAGTSLAVTPFAHLPDLVDDETPRVLFNMEAVGDLGERENDVVVLGDCDDNIEMFRQLIGWTSPSQPVGQEPSVPQTKEQAATETTTTTTTTTTTNEKKTTSVPDTAERDPDRETSTVDASSVVNEITQKLDKINL